MKYNIGDTVYWLGGNLYYGKDINANKFCLYHDKITKYNNKKGYKFENFDLVWTTEEELDRRYKKTESQEEAKELFLKDFEKVISQVLYEKMITELKLEQLNRKLEELKMKLRALE